MRRRRTGRENGRIGVLLLVFLVSRDWAMAGDNLYDLTRLRWSRLEYRASKLLIKGTSTVVIRAEDASDARSHWDIPIQGAPSAPAGGAVVHVELSSQFLGKSSRLDLWLDPSTAAALQRTQLETGRKVRYNRHRSLRFTDTGVSVSTRRATEETVGGPLDRWHASEEFAAYPRDLPVGAVVTEPSALFYLLAVAPLAGPGEEMTAFVFAKGRVTGVTLAVEERTEIGVEYLQTDSSQLEEQWVRERVAVLRVRLDGRPVGESEGQPDFRLLGLGGDLEVLLDPERRLPVQISGDIKGAGRGRVRLQRVLLRQ